MAIINQQPQQIEIPLYYEERLVRGTNRIVLIKNDEKGKERMEQQEEAIKQKQGNNEKILDTDRPVKVLNTKWKDLSWGDQNRITRQSERSTAEGSFALDYFTFRDMRLKTCLVDWDMTDDKGKKIPVNPQIIDQLPPDVVIALVEKFDAIISISTEENEKNS
jgi:hypothetical protein